MFQFSAMLAKIAKRLCFTEVFAMYRNGKIEQASKFARLRHLNERINKNQNK